MAITSSNELESLLNAAELQVARRKRWAVTLIVVSILLAIVLVAASIYMVNDATRRTKQLEYRASSAITKARKANEELARVENQKKNAQAGLEHTRRAAENLGIALFRQRNFPAAIRAYDSALSVDPGNVYLVHLKGYAYFKMRDYAKAVETLEAAVRQDPKYLHAYLDLARVQCATGNFDAARQTALKANVSPHEHTYMAGDGEFIRLCRPLLHELRLPQVPTQ